VEILQSTLAGVRVGEPRQFRNLTLFPLFGGAAIEPDYLTVDEAIESGDVEITEGPNRASVGELQFQNRGASAVLVIDGEELIGAMQNRIVNVTILVPAKSKVTIPVSCVERGRWSARSRAFQPAPQTQFATGRASRLFSVSRSLAEGAGFSGDQGAVWHGILAKEAALGHHSPTEAMADIYQSRDPELSEFVDALQPEPEQTGAAFVLPGTLVALELFDSAATLRRLLPKLVRSFAVDAIDPRYQGGGRAQRELVLDLIERLRQAKRSVFPAIGEGENVRIDDLGLTASALVARERVVHLTAYSPVAGRSAR